MERLDLRRNWPAVVLAIAAVVLIPWAIALGQMLPSRHVARHWDAAWTGFDVILAFSLLATAWAAFRRQELVRSLAAVSGTLLVCDAWFDVTTAIGTSSFLVSALLAVCVELPVAGWFLWVAHRIRHNQLVRIYELLGADPATIHVSEVPIFGPPG